MARGTRAGETLSFKTHPSVLTSSCYMIIFFFLALPWPEITTGRAATVATPTQLEGGSVGDSDALTWK